MNAKPIINAFKQLLGSIKFHILTLFFLSKEPKLPLIVKGFAIFTVYYFLSPIDLIPDFIPLLGQLDDVLIVPTLIFLVYKFSPRNLITSSQLQAKNTPFNLSKKAFVGVLFVLVWIVLITGLYLFVSQKMY